MIRVTLRKMNEDEYIVWKEWSVSDYAKSLVESGQYSGCDAHAQAESDFSEGLADGLSTKNNHVLVAENIQGIPVGMIWYETENPKYAFINDFVVYAEYRRMGYGHAILTELEHTLRLADIPSVVLHVFEHNNSAIRLYEKCGFTIIKVDRAKAGSLYMKKQFYSE